MQEFSTENLSKRSLVLASGFLLLFIGLTVLGNGGDVVQSLTSGNYSLNDFESIKGLAATQPKTNAEETNTVDLQQGLQGYWRFDNPQVSRGYSLEFGENYLSFETPEGLPVGDSSFTTSIWVKYNGSKENDAILGWGVSNPNSASGQELRDGGWQHYFYGNDLNCYEIGLNDSRWHHISVTFDADNDNRSMYMDGELKCSDDPGAVDINKTNLLVGQATSSEILNGVNLDDLRLYNNSLSPSEVQDLYNEHSVSSEGLVLHQDFNEGPEDCDLTSNEACLEDKSGNGNDGTPNNFDDNQFNTGSGWLNETPLNRPSLEDSSENSNTGRFYGGNNGELKNFDFNSSSGWTEGVEGDSALKFDGTDSFVRRNNTEFGDSSDGFTVSHWVHRNGTTQESYFVTAASTDLGGSNTHYAGFKNDGDGERMRFTVYDGSFQSITEDSNYELDEWQHYVGVFDEGEMTLYRDGVEVASATVSSTVDIYDTLSIGAHPEDAGQYFEGRLDEIRWYDRPLSSSEVESLYQGESVTKGLVIRWNFEAGDRKTAYDTSSFDRTGILGTSGMSFEDESVESSQDSSLDQKIAISSWIKSSQGATEASGGETYYVKDNNTVYEVQAFTETGESKLKVRESIQADVLVVAGGGGGGGRHGAGGGAGGLIFKEDYQLGPNESINVKVGQGGGGGSGNGDTPGERGSNSTFANLTAIGGGGGTSADSTANQDGGSGSGKNSYQSPREPGTGLQPSSESGGYGNKGGDTTYGGGSPYNHAGGGGAGSKGGNGTTQTPGYGGNGRYYGDVFSDKVGENGYFAGGGGGGSHDPRPEYFNNTGGIGGGGNGGMEPYSRDTESGGIGDDGEDGLANTGGGGGGGSTDSSSGGGGGNGGSGIVLVRYPIDKVVSVNSGEYLLGVENDKLIGSVGNSTISAEIKGGSWQHVALNFDGSTQELYVNGERRVSSQFDGTVSPDSEDLVIGKNFNGEIDETKIYNRSLSEKEIQRLGFQ